MRNKSQKNSRGLGNTGFTRISTLHVLALSGVTAVGTGGALVSANQELAMTNAVELVKLAQSQARTTALRSGETVRMVVDAEAGRIRVVVMSDDVRSSEVLVREVAPPAVAIESEFETICYDGMGQPFVGGDCEEHFGSITIRTLKDKTTLTLSGGDRFDLR
ncbi:MAG: hypothetical protein OEU54_03420 [Gemmatimonadota bacterium]|nr:hypothetical protein [Gemmatimonadota bacterium]